MVKKETKTSRFGMRVAPTKKTTWEQTAQAWGYKSTSEWLEAMADWAIGFEKWEGDYEKYLSTLKGA
jgi:hypothetical protein